MPSSFDHDKAEWKKFIVKNLVNSCDQAHMPELALTCLKTRIYLVNNVNPALATNQTVGAMATLERF